LNEIRAFVGEKVEYFKLVEHFKDSPEKLSVFTELFNQGFFDIKEDENGVIWVIPKEKKEKPKLDEETIKTRKEALRILIEGTMKVEKKTLSDIQISLITALGMEKRGRDFQKLIDKIWFSLPINGVRIYHVGDELYYEIEMEGESIKIRDVEILSPTRFRSQVFNKFNILLPKPSQICYCLWLMYLRSVAEEERKLKNVETEEDIVRDAVIEYIESSYVSKNMADCMRYGFVYKDNGKIFVPSNFIAKIVERALGRSLKHNKIASYLKDLIISIQPRRYKDESGNTRRRRFWIFDASKFKLREEVKDEENES